MLIMSSGTKYLLSRLWILLLGWGFVTCQLTTRRPYPTVLNIGAVISRYPDSMDRRNDGWGWENVGSAIHIAVDKFNAAGGLIGGVEIK